MNKPKRPELRLIILNVIAVSSFIQFAVPDAKGAPRSSYASGIGVATQPGAAPQAAEGQTLSNRIAIIPPKSSHPPVNPAVLPAVRTALSQLPGSIYRLLDEKGATVTIAPNIEDKWPGSGDCAKPDVADGTLGEEPGRTYGRDVHIYEREKVRGSNDLKEARAVSEMIRVL